MERGHLGIGAAKILYRDKGRYLAGALDRILRDLVEAAGWDGAGISFSRIAEDAAVESLNVSAKGRHCDDRDADRTKEGEEAAGECKDEGEGQTPCASDAMPVAVEQHRVRLPPQGKYILEQVAVDHEARHRRNQHRQPNYSGQ